jgi:hypothetical protein
MTDVVLSPAQLRYLERTAGLPRLHHSICFGVAPSLTSDIVQQALRRLMSDQEVFASRFTDSSAMRGSAVVPEVHEIRADWPEPAKLPAGATDVLHNAIDPAAGRHLEAGLVMGPAGARTLILVAHHLVTDIVSWRVIRESISRHARAVLARREPAPLPPGCGFWSWTAGLADLVRAGRLDHMLAEWLAAVYDAGEPIDAGTEADSRVAQVVVPASGVNARQMPALVVGALSHALGGESRFEVEGHGRVVEHLDRDAVGSVGWYTCRFPVRVQCETPSVSACLAAARRALSPRPEILATFGALRYLAPNGHNLRYRPAVSVNFRGQGGRAPRAGTALLGEAEQCPGPSTGPSLPRTAPWEIDVVATPATITISLSYNSAAIDAVSAAEVLARAGSTLSAALAAPPR